jgi:hypothetical protein
MRRTSKVLKMLVGEIEDFWIRRNRRVLGDKEIPGTFSCWEDKDTESIDEQFQRVEYKALEKAHMKTLEAALATRKAKMYKGLVTKAERDAADRLFEEFEKTSLSGKEEAIDKKKLPDSVRRQRLGLFYKRCCIKYGIEIGVWRDSVKNTIQASKDLKAFLGQDTNEFSCPPEPKVRFWDMTDRDMGKFVIQQRAEKAAEDGDGEAEADPLVALAASILPEREEPEEKDPIRLEDLSMAPLKLPVPDVKPDTFERIIEVESDAGAPKLGAREWAAELQEKYEDAKKKSQKKPRFSKFG